VEKIPCHASHLRYDAVTSRSQSVHPRGQPIRLSTNTGFRTLRIVTSDDVSEAEGDLEGGYSDCSLGEESDPAESVSRAGREGRSPRLASVSRLAVPALGRELLIPFCDEPYCAAVGVGKSSPRFFTMPASVRFPRMYVPEPLVASEVIGVGNAHSRIASVSIVPGCMRSEDVVCRALCSESVTVEVGQRVG
jgi:hypothetical protein